MKENKLPVSEVFYSIQGEGKTVGYPSVFVRLGGCNLMCGGQGTQFDGELHNGATWRCDTIEVWMKSLMTPIGEILSDELLERLNNGAHLIITGGEPLLHQNNIIEFLKFVKTKVSDCSLFVEVETNGTIEPSKGILPFIQQYNVSPKLSNSGNTKDTRFNKSALEVLNSIPITQFKFVISTKEDWEEVKKDFDFIKKDKIVLMPSGENQVLLNSSREITADICIKEGLFYSDRLHIVIWNQKTGV